MTLAISFGEPALVRAFKTVAENIVDAAERHAHGGLTAISPSGTVTATPWLEMLRLASCLAEGLKADGYLPGDALVIRFSDTTKIVAAIQAAALGNFVAVPMTSGALAHPARLPPLLGEVFRRYCVLDEAEFDRLSAHPAPAVITPAPCAETDLRVAISTSGTTGKQRFVGLSDRAALSRWWPKRPEAANARGFMAWSSFDHVMGISVVMPDLPSKVHLAASRFVSQPLTWLDAIVEHDVTHAATTSFGLGLVVQAVLKAPERQWDLSRVIRIGVGAEMVSRQNCEQFLSALAPFGLRQDAVIGGYGMSECGPVAGGGTSLVAGAGALDAPPELDRPGHGHAIRIVSETGEILREGELGQIEVQGPSMTNGYLGDPEANARLFTEDGWLRSGDLGILRNGKITVVGREKEQIQINAKKYASQEIEAAVRRATGLTGVFAAPLAAQGAGAPLAVFIVDEQADQPLDQIAAEVRSATAAAFRFAPAVVARIRPDQVPRTAVGKVRRLAMAELLGGPNAPAQHRLGERHAAAEAAPPQGTEQRLERIWRDSLGDAAPPLGTPIDRDVDYYAIGGDSLSAVRLACQIEDEFGKALDIQGFNAALTIGELAKALSGGSADVALEGQARQTPAPVALPVTDRVERAGFPDWMATRLHGFLQDWPGIPALPGGFIRLMPGGAPDAAKPPIFWCLQTKGECESLGGVIGRGHQVFGLRSGLQIYSYDSEAAEAMVGIYVDEISRITPRGPLILGGTCQGATLMLRVLRRLVELGRDVRLFAVVDSNFASLAAGTTLAVPAVVVAGRGSRFNPYRQFRYPEVGLAQLAPQGFKLMMVNGSYSQLMVAPANREVADAIAEAAIWANGLTARVAVQAAPSNYMPRKIKSPVTVLSARAGDVIEIPVRLTNETAAAWQPFAASGLTIGNHWLSADGEIIVLQDGRSKVERALDSGASCLINLTVKVPDAPGPAMLEIDLIEEGIRWTGESISVPLQIPVNIHPSDSGLGAARLGGKAALYRMMARFARGKETSSAQS